MYYTYMLRCADNSIYTGITTDLNRRMNEHFTKHEKAAKYTHSHTAIKLEIAWTSENKSLASKLEYHIKHLNKQNKESLIKNKNLEKYLKNKINANSYNLILNKIIKS